MGPGSDHGSQEEPSTAYLLQRLAVATARPVSSMVAPAAPPTATASDAGPTPTADPTPTATPPDPAAPDPAAPGDVAPRAAGCAPAEQGVSDRSLIVARRTRMVPIATFDVPAEIRPIAPPDGWTDVLTGADGPRLWDRLILSEGARVARYHRPVTVAFAEIVGIDKVATTWGWDVAARALASCARRLGREIRSSDHIARLEQSRFGILLTETSEIAAINFVERARASCERELRAIGDDVAIGFGWASPPDKGDLSDAVDIALTRLAAELAVDPAD